MLLIDMKFVHGILMVDLDGELTINNKSKVERHLTDLIKENGIKYVLLNLNNVLEIDKPGIKSEYFNSDYSNCPELVKPTIDFIAPSNFKSSKLFIPHYLFMIDISEKLSF